MDEISRAWAILCLPPGSSEEAVKGAYRGLVKEWHPDKFQGQPDELNEAHEMLKEINWAYDYLREHAFAALPDSSAVEPAGAAAGEMQTEQTDLEVSGSGKARVWAFVAVAFAVLMAAGLYFFRSGFGRAGKVAAGTVSEKATHADATARPPEPVEEPLSVNPIDKNIVRTMVPANRLQITESPDGLILKGATRDYLHTMNLLRPPFVFRATMQTDSSDVRFYYGLGMVIFNWADNPIELRVHDFATSAITPVLHKGGLTAKEWHELVFDIRTNSMAISVDGEVRFEKNGFYQNLLAAPGIGPSAGEMKLKSVVVDVPPDAANVPEPAVVPRVWAPGDLLATMKPMSGLEIITNREGLVLFKRTGQFDSGYIKTTQSFRPPLRIHTRAKTDSIDMRLYYGSGMVILNWEANPGELRVHDPASGRVIGVPEKGRILPNQWHDIIWEVQPGGMRLVVDGQVRFQNNADYRKVEGTARIGPVYSRVTVASFVVEQR